VRPVFAYWPTTVPRSLVETRTEVRTARQWAELSPQSVAAR
jgi:hypothetical protein